MGGVTLGAQGRLRAVFPAGVTAWKRGEGAPQLCDACQRGFFNSHWSCARCGFQLCPDCHRSRREADGHGTGMGGGWGGDLQRGCQPHGDLAGTNPPSLRCRGSGTAT